MAVASGAPMKMGRVRPSPSDSCSSSTGVLDWRSTRTARSRTSTMPQTYSPETRSAIVGPIAGTWPVPAPAPRSAVEQVAEGAPEQGGTQLLAQSRQLVGRLVGPRPGLGIPLPDQGKHDLLDEPRLAVGGVLVEPEVTGLDPVPAKPAARLATARASSSKYSARRPPWPEQSELPELLEHRHVGRGPAGAPRATCWRRPAAHGDRRLEPVATGRARAPRAGVGGAAGGGVGRRAGRPECRGSSAARRRRRRGGRRSAARAWTARSRRPHGRRHRPPGVALERPPGPRPRAGRPGVRPGRRRRRRAHRHGGPRDSARRTGTTRIAGRPRPPWVSSTSARTGRSARPGPGPVRASPRPATHRSRESSPRRPWPWPRRRR